MPNNLVCFGLMCPKHEACKLYVAVDGSTDEERQVTCDHGDGTFPMYEEVSHPTEGESYVQNI